MNAMELKRNIDLEKDEISVTIARTELQKAWSLHGKLCDLIECNGLPWDDETTAYWQQAVDETGDWLASAQNVEAEIMPSYRPAHGNDETGCAEEAYCDNNPIDYIGDFA